jgi:hypothetical protein
MKTIELAQAIEDALTGKSEVSMPWMLEITEEQKLKNRIEHARKIVRDIINPSQD